MRCNSRRVKQQAQVRCLSVAMMTVPVAFLLLAGARREAREDIVHTLWRDANVKMLLSGAWPSVKNRRYGGAPRRSHRVMPVWSLSVRGHLGVEREQKWHHRVRLWRWAKR